MSKEKKRETLPGLVSSQETIKILGSDSESTVLQPFAMKMEELSEDDDSVLKPVSMSMSLRKRTKPAASEPPKKKKKSNPLAFNEKLFVRIHRVMLSCLGSGLPAYVELMGKVMIVLTNLRALEYSVKRLNRLGCQKILGGRLLEENESDTVTCNACDLVYDAVYFGKDMDDDMIAHCLRTLGKKVKNNIEMHDVAERMKMDGSEVNHFVSSVFGNLHIKFKEMRQEKIARGDVKESLKKYQCDYAKVLLDAAFVISMISVRVDCLNKEGIMAASKEIKAKGLVNNAIGAKTADRVLMVIRYDGQVEWKSIGYTLDLVPITD